MTRCRVLHVLMFFLLAIGLQAAPSLPTYGDRLPPPEAFVQLDNALAPDVAYALGAVDGSLEIIVRVACLRGDEVALELGIAADKTLMLQTADSRMVAEPGVRWFRFLATPAQVGIEDGVWDELRMGLSVAWLGGPYGQARQRERFRHLSVAAPHAGLSSEPAEWAPLSVQEYLDRLSGQDRIRFAIEQPMDGKMTVVIEDADGNRLRNLMGGQPTTRGRHELTWDGLDDFGQLVPPGDYRWRSAHHPGVTAEFLFNFDNGGVRDLTSTLSNHGLFLAACTNGREIFLGSPITEGGWALIALDAQGRWLSGYQQQHGTGYRGIAIAADEQYFYAVNDGLKLNRDTNTTVPDWQVEGYLTLTRWDVTSTQLRPYGRQSFVRFEEYQHGPGAETPGTHSEASLGGAALIGKELFVASRAAQALLVLDTATGEVVRRIPLPEPGALTVAGEHLLAISAGAIVRITPATGNVEPYLAIPDLMPVGLTVDDEGQLYVTDSISHTVRIFVADGQAVGSIGELGGPYQGKFEPRRMVRPQGVAVLAGKLWVAENRRNPKRAVGWELATREVAHELYGNPPYGSPGAVFDPRDPTHWIASRAGWRLDFENGTATCTSVLQKEGGHLGGAIAFCTNYRMHHQDGRIFLLGQDKANIVSELMPDGSLRDLALIGGAHGVLYAMNWKPVPGFKAAFEEKFPRASVLKKYGGSQDWRNAAVFWVDQNGDGIAQQEEFQIGESKEELWGSGWGLSFHDLTLRLIVTRPDKQNVLVALQPDGYLEGGAPAYPSWRDAMAAAVPLTEHPAGTAGITRYHSTLVDSRGNLILNGDPYMTAYSPAGKLLWHYPNRWVNVHGSHKAPLPSIGEMQGNLFFLGSGVLDAQTDVTMLVGNHGRFFALTTDGIYLDELFRDCRVGGPNDAQYIGGEAFGGVFGKTDDGRWLLQTGPGGYRIYQVHGLDAIETQQGSISLTPRQLELAAQRIQRSEAAPAAPLAARAPRRAEPPAIDGRDNDWPTEQSAVWDRDGRFAVRARAAWDDELLYLFYRVQDPSPWINQGVDWLTLFKTGDAVDFHIGTDPTAPATRRDPAPGDIRLLIAPFEGEIIGVLYRYRQPGGENPVRFDSPWRSLQVDSVTRVEGLRAAVERSGGGYGIEVAVPLKALGLAPAKGAHRGDFGVLFGDAEGTRIALRSYWANPHTGLMYDVPGEAAITPREWATITFETEER